MGTARQMFFRFFHTFKVLPHNFFDKKKGI